MYHCRMQYLKSREGGLRGKQRRKSSFGLEMFEPTERNHDAPQFSCLDEKVHGPCTPEILVPPSELMTRPRAFRQAYWRHHCKPTVRAIEKLELSQSNERKNRLNKKRKEILAKIRAKEKVRREKDIRRRAERVLNHHSDGGIESDDSRDESESELEEQLGMMNLLSHSSHSGESSPCRGRITTRSTIVNSARRNRRTLVGQKAPSQISPSLNSEDEVGPEDDAFSFLSEWSRGESAKKIRW